MAHYVQNFVYLTIFIFRLGLVADPVIKAIARLELEDGMRMGVLAWLEAAGTLVAAAPSPGSVLDHPSVLGGVD